MNKPLINKNSPPEPEELTREELEWFYKKWRDKNWPKDKTEKFKDIDKELKNSSFFTKTRICEIYKVSRQMFNRWKRLNTQSKGKLNDEWVKLINNQFYKMREVAGYRRVYLELRDQGINISLSTVRRYMNTLNLKSKIRGGRKARKKFKPVNTTHNKKDLLERNFNDKTKHEVIVTDITEFWLGTQKVYISICVDLFNWELMDIVVGRNKGNIIVVPNIKNTFEKISKNRETILHSDNGSEYSSNEIKKLKHLYNFKQSFSRPGKYQDNRVIEYVISIIKTEYINIDCKGMSFEEFLKYSKWMMHHYNNIRKQGNLGWKTPQMFAVLSS